MIRLSTLGWPVKRPSAPIDLSAYSVLGEIQIFGNFLSILWAFLYISIITLTTSQYLIKTIIRNDELLSLIYFSLRRLNVIPWLAINTFFVCLPRIILVGNPLYFIKLYWEIRSTNGYNQFDVLLSSSSYINCIS